MLIFTDHIMVIDIMCRYRHHMMLSILCIIAGMLCDCDITYAFRVLLSRYTFLNILTLRFVNN
jgi:hypothetical protein